MLKLIAASFAAILAVASGAAKPGLIGAPVAYSSPFVAGNPVVSAYSAVPGVYGAASVVSSYGAAPVVSSYRAAPVVSSYGAPLAYTAHAPVAYLG